MERLEPDTTQKQQVVERLELADIQKRQEELLNLSSYTDTVTVAQIQEFLKTLAQAGIYTEDVNQRSLLRSFIRYWESFIYDKTGSFPLIQLQPFDETASYDTGVTSIEEPSLQLKKSYWSHIRARFVRYIKAYEASLIVFGPALLLVASAMMVVLYLTPSFSLLLLPIPLIWNILVYSNISAVIIWLILALPRSYFATAQRANRRSYDLLKARLDVLAIRLGITEGPDGKFRLMTVKQMQRNGKLDVHSEYLTALKEALTSYRDINDMLRESSTGLQWILGTGYGNAWRVLHHAEEALIEFVPPQEIVREAIHDLLAIQGSTIANRDDMVASLRQASTELDPGASMYFQEHQPEQTLLSQLVQDVGEQKKLLSQLAQDSKKDTPLAIDNITETTESIPSDTDSQTADRARVRARAILREVRATLNEFRDTLWLRLVQTRNRLLVTMALMGVIPYLLLSIAILASDPKSATSSSAIMAAVVFYLVGAVVGLFGRLYEESLTISTVEDLGLTTMRLILTPLLSGLAGIGGVLIVTTLFEGVNRPVSLQAVFSIDVRYLLVAAIFGLSPNLIITRIQQGTRKALSDLQGSESSGQEDQHKHTGKTGGRSNRPA